MKKCECQECENPAEFFDEMGNMICEDCMNCEIADGAAPEDFESI